MMKHKLEMPLEQFAEAVAKENCRLNEHNEKLKGQTKLYFDAFNKAIARIEVLEAALQEFIDPCIEHCFDTCQSECDPMKDCPCFKARKALEGKDD